MNDGVFKRIILYCLIGFILILLLIFLLNFIVVFKTKNRILLSDEYSKIDNVDCIIVLGAGIRGKNPSPLLKDRLDKAIELYNLGMAPRVIMSGDHGSDDHDEVNVMKQYAIDNGIPSSDIFMDHAGFSTYDTMYRAKNIFGVDRAIVVTQRYHLYRSIYIAQSLGIEAFGVPAENNKYSGRIFREIREVLARDKDVVKCIMKPKSKYLGEKIDITGDGNITND